jgi:hypothetical protein
MQVGQYGGESGYGRERRNSGPYAASQYRDETNSYYNPPPRDYDDRYDDRPSSRGSRRERERSRERSRDRGEKKHHGGHEAEKAVGATLLGGAVGGCK